MAQVATVEPQDEVNLRDLLDVLVRRRWIILLVFLACVAGALGVSFMSPPRYQATATLVLDRSDRTPTLFPELAAVSGQTYLDTLAEVVRSRSVAERAAQRLGYTDDEVAEAITKLQRALKVSRVRGADMIRIEVTDRRPDEAARRARAVTDAFLSFLLEGRQLQAKATREFIEEQLAKVSQDLRAAEDALLRFRQAQGEVNLPEESRIKLQKLAELEAQLVATQTERRAMEAQRDRAAEELRRRQQVAPSTWVTSPLVQTLRQQLATLEIQLAGLLEKFTERHPDVLATRAQVAETKRRLEAELRRELLAQTYTIDPVYQGLIQQTVSAEVTSAALRAREEALQRAVARWTGQVRGLPAKELALARLERQRKVAENVYLLLSQKYYETRIAEASVVPDLRVVDPATPPEQPVSPRRGLAALLGAVVGAVVAIGAGFGAEWLDSRFRNPEQAEQVLALPLLAVVPHVRETDGKVPLAKDSARSAFAESFRTLRTGILYSAPEGGLRTVVVTSPEPRAGKSTVATNLSLALARSGRRVVLVDADLRRPTLLEVLQPPHPFGLSDYLVGEAGPEEVVQPTGDPMLRFIPAGSTAPNPAELLGSDQMRHFLSELRERFDMVVLDSPPVLAVADAAILARQADGVLLVVNPGTTPREAAVRAKRQLEGLGGKILGFVFNGVPVDSRRGYYGYAYYGYYAYGDEPKPAERGSKG